MDAAICILQQFDRVPPPAACLAEAADASRLSAACLPSQQVFLQPVVSGTSHTGHGNARMTQNATCGAKDEQLPTLVRVQVGAPQET